jgi:hypothetical protein
MPNISFEQENNYKVNLLATQALLAVINLKPKHHP